MSRFSKSFFWAFLVLTLHSNCNTVPLPQTLPAGFAKILVAVGLPKSGNDRLSADPADVAVVRAAVKWAGGSTPEYEMTRVGPIDYRIEIGMLPIDVPLQLTTRAFDDAEGVLFEGEIPEFFVGDGTTTNLVIDLLPMPGTGPGVPPQITAVHRPSLPVHVNNIFALGFSVMDVDDTLLQYSLQASSGHFLLPNGTLPLVGNSGFIMPVFVAPSTPGEVTITAIFTDGVGFLAKTSFPLSVLPTPSANDGTSGGLIETNFAPTIHGVQFATAEGSSHTELFAIVTDDQPISELQFTWVFDNSIIVNGNPVQTSSNSGPLPVALQVVDAHGASVMITFKLDTAAPGYIDLPYQNQPPNVTGATLSNQNVSYGDEVIATVYSSDPDSAQLSATWSTSWGTIIATSSVESNGGWMHTARWTGGTEVNSALLTALVSDSLGGQIQYSFTIHQVLGQVALTANAGSDQSKFIGQPFTLDASGSSSSDGQITSFLWTQLSGPASVIQSPASAVTPVMPTAVGTYVYQLNVTNVNNSDTDTLTVTVSDPTQFSFADADADLNGVVYFFDTVSHKIRRYEMENAVWLDSFETAPIVASMAVAPNGSTVYIGVEGGRIDALNPQTGVTTTFAQNSGTVNEMVVADNYLFFQDTISSTTSRGLFDRQNGVRTAYGTASYRSSQFVYSSLVSRVFQQRDGVSPNDILYITINQQNGTLGSTIDSPYHGDYSLGYPMRVFPDQSKLVVSSGPMFSTSNLTIAGTLGQSYTDLCFYGLEPRLIKASGNNTQILFLSGDFSLARIQIVPGTPLRILHHDGNLYIISTNGANNVQVNIVGGAI